MQSVVQHQRARVETIDAVEYYERQRPGLGAQFLAEVEAAIQAVGANPNTGFLYENGLRMRMLKRFPYGVVFGERRGKIVIFAVAHHRRKPGYWAKRLEDEPE
jgi:toxin ParE1/3/4